MSNHGRNTEMSVSASVPQLRHTVHNGQSSTFALAAVLESCSKGFRQSCKVQTHVADTVHLS